MDRWMLTRTAALVRDCRKWYDVFEFHRVYHALYDFAVVDLSAFYFDVLKDRLYTFAPRNRARRSAQTAVYRIAGALLRLAAPILSFTAEEIWKHFPHSAGDPDSVHLALFPAAEELGSPLDPTKAANWEKLLAVRTEVLRALESARNAKTISGALEAKVVLSAAKRSGADAGTIQKLAARPLHCFAGGTRRGGASRCAKIGIAGGIEREGGASRRRNKMRALLELFHARG